VLHKPPKLIKKPPASKEARRFDAIMKNSLTNLKLSKKLSKKGQMQTLQSLGFGLIVLGITLGIGAYVMSQIKTKITDNSSLRVIGNATEGLVTLSSWLGILVIAAVGGIAIWFIVSYISGQHSR